eukprot:1146458-Pelagomonas_calceolata.AAC.4
MAGMSLQRDPQLGLGGGRGDVGEHTLLLYQDLEHIWHHAASVPEQGGVCVRGVCVHASARADECACARVHDLACPSTPAHAYSWIWDLNSGDHLFVQLYVDFKL